MGLSDNLTSKERRALRRSQQFATTNDSSNPNLINSISCVVPSPVVPVQQSIQPVVVQSIIPQSVPSPSPSPVTNITETTTKTTRINYNKNNDNLSSKERRALRRSQQFATTNDSSNPTLINSISCVVPSPVVPVQQSIQPLVVQSIIPQSVPSPSPSPVTNIIETITKTTRINYNKNNDNLSSKERRALRRSQQFATNNMNSNANIINSNSPSVPTNIITASALATASTSNMNGSVTVTVPNIKENVNISSTAVDSNHLSSSSSSSSSLSDSDNDTDSDLSSDSESDNNKNNNNNTNNKKRKRKKKLRSKRRSRSAKKVKLTDNMINTNDDYNDVYNFDHEETIGKKVINPIYIMETKLVGTSTHALNFEIYYRHQQILNDYEWNDFLSYLRRELPVSFRFNRSHFAYTECEKLGLPLLKSDLKIFDSKRGMITKPKQLKWCNGWQLGFGKSGLKYNQSDHYRSIRQWLTKYTAIGALTRQEIVSMIPVSFADINPGHKVLDMCAAPGSKTTQILEGLKKVDMSSTGKSQGILIANDCDPKRAYLLCRRLNAMGQNCQYTMVTRHKAQKFPNVLFGGSKSKNNHKNVKKTKGVYDRIICDVPCCGDGTLRKSPEVWHKWHPEFAVGLHSLQLQIVMRGISLLKKNGIIVYSTCTFNPIENEAVVAALLQRCKGAVELVDASRMMPELKRSPGITKWDVFDDEMRIFKTYEASQIKKLGSRKKKFRRSMWPPAEEIIPDLHLERCMRFYPHIQDTGGFFVAVLKKVQSMPTFSKNKDKNEDGDEYKEETDGKMHNTHVAAVKIHSTNKEDSMGHRYIPVKPETLTEMKNFFGLDEIFFNNIVGKIYTRSNIDTQKGRSLNYISNEIQKHCFEQSQSHHLNQVMAGMKIIKGLNSRSGAYQLTHEGAQLFINHMSKQVLKLTRFEMQKVLNLLGNTISIQKLLPFSRGTGLLPGPCVLVLEETFGSDDPLAVPAQYYDTPEPALKIIYTYVPGLEKLPEAFAEICQTRIQKFEAMERTKSSDETDGDVDNDNNNTVDKKFSAIWSALNF